jgi:hypothetical protein
VKKCPGKPEEKEFLEMFNATLLLVVAATALNGILAGASLDQSIKQLPARHRIGAVAYSAYTQAADLGRNGLIWYPSIGIGAALLTIGAAGAAVFQGVEVAQAVPIYIAAALSILHSLLTTQAAPTMWSQRRYGQDEATLGAVFDRFERLHTMRALLQVLTFGVMLWALVAFGR